MKLYKTGQNKNVAYSTENQKSETDWELAVLLIKETECTSAGKSPNCMKKFQWVEMKKINTILDKIGNS